MARIISSWTGPKQKEGGDNKRGYFFSFPFVSGGKHFPEISHRLPLTSLPELSPLSKPGPKGNGLTMTALRLHVIVVTIATETKLGVGRQGRIETDSYTLLVFYYSSRNWLSDCNPFDLSQADEQWLIF